MNTTQITFFWPAPNGWLSIADVCVRIDMQPAEVTVTSAGADVAGNEFLDGNVSADGAQSSDVLGVVALDQQDAVVQVVQGFGNLNDLGAHGSGTGIGNQFGPDSLPIPAKVLASDGAFGFAFDQNAQRRTSLPVILVRCELREVDRRHADLLGELHDATVRKAV